MSWDSQKSFWMRMNKCAPEHKDSAYPYQKKKKVTPEPEEVFPIITL